MKKSQTVLRLPIVQRKERSTVDRHKIMNLIKTTSNLNSEINSNMGSMEGKRLDIDVIKQIRNLAHSQQQKTEEQMKIFRYTGDYSANKT